MKTMAILLIIVSQASAGVIRWVDSDGNVALQDDTMWKWVSLGGDAEMPPLTTSWDDIGQIPGQPDYREAIWPLGEVEPPYQWTHGHQIVRAIEGPEWGGVHAWTSFSFPDASTVSTNTYRQLSEPSSGDFYVAVFATLHLTPEPTTITLLSLGLACLLFRRVPHESPSDRRCRVASGNPVFGR